MPPAPQDTSAQASSTILTLALDPASAAYFDRLRRAQYPTHLNRIAAHLTLFHTLPATVEVGDILRMEAAALAPFRLCISGVRSLGRGVAYSLNSPELQALHRRLASAFAEHLTLQDRQGFRPHVVVQNKVSGAEAKTLLARLESSFVPTDAEAVGLSWWTYLGGPWELRETFTFASGGSTAQE